MTTLKLPRPDNLIILPTKLMIRVWHANSKCLDVLRLLAPEMIDTLPMRACAPQVEGKAMVVYQPLRFPTMGLLVCYFGYGFPADDNGWMLNAFTLHAGEDFDARMDEMIRGFTAGINARKPL